MQFYIYISNFSNQPMTKENKSQHYVFKTLEKHRDYFYCKSRYTNTIEFDWIENGYQEFATCKCIIKEYFQIPTWL